MALGLVDRCHGDVHRLALEERRPLRDPVVLDSIHELRQQVPSELRMGQLASAEADGHLDPIAFLEEFDRPMDLGVEVTDADLRREADFLEGHRALLALGFLLALREIVLVLSEVQEFDHRWRCHRRDLDEVVAAFLRHLERPWRGHDAQLGTLFIDDPDLWDPDHLVDSQVSADGLSPSVFVSVWTTGAGSPRPDRPKREDITGRPKPATKRLSKERAAPADFVLVRVVSAVDECGSSCARDRRAPRDQAVVSRSTA